MIARTLLLSLMSLTLCSVSLAAPENLADPMRPPAFALQKFKLEKLKQNPLQAPAAPKAKQPESQWELNSILYSKNRQHAIINNQLVKKGDTIDGARLVRLTADSVRLIKNGKIIDLDLRSGFPAVRKSVGGRNL